VNNLAGMTGIFLTMLVMIYAQTGLNVKAGCGGKG